MRVGVVIFNQNCTDWDRRERDHVRLQPWRDAEVAGKGVRLFAPEMA